MCLFHNHVVMAPSEDKWGSNEGFEIDVICWTNFARVEWPQLELVQAFKRLDYCEACSDQTWSVASWF